MPHFPQVADDMMDYPCHCRCRQRHSATDKVAALLHAENAAILLHDFRRAVAGVLPSGLCNVLLG